MAMAVIQQRLQLLLLLSRQNTRRRFVCRTISCALAICYILLQIWQIKVHNALVGSATTSQNVGYVASFGQNASTWSNSLSSPSKTKSDLLPASTNQTSTISSRTSLLQDLQGTSHVGNMTTNSPLQTIPSWLQDYQMWHAQQRAKLQADNWRNFSYLVMQCLETDLHCGGTADRLRPVPLILWIAHCYRRILFIHWTTPKPLEEFLLPPPTTTTQGGGLDWRLPNFVAIHEPSPWSDMILSSSSQLDMIQQRASNATIWHFRYQTHDAGEAYYNERRPKGCPTFAQSYHAIWRLLFTPTPPIAQRIEQHLKELNLIPGQYSAVHIRAAYNQQDRIGKNRVRARVQSAINCASQLGQAGTPILVASDSLFALEVAMTYARKRQEQGRYHRRIVTRLPPTASADTNQSVATFMPLHLEKAANPEQRKASDYYDIFVDLYLMGMSQCVVYTKGGFGYWARLISYNSSCGFRYQSAKTQTCRWFSPGTPSAQSATPSVSLGQTPIFASTDTTRVEKLPQVLTSS